jgi:hypothetical protein
MVKRDPGDPASFGVNVDGSRIGGLSEAVDIYDDAITTALPLWSTFSGSSVLPEWSKTTDQNIVGEINDAVKEFWHHGLDSYFHPTKRGQDPELQALWLSLQDGKGNYDQGKFFDWFIANAHTIEEPALSKSKRLSKENAKIFGWDVPSWLQGGNYDHTIFKQ